MQQQQQNNNKVTSHEGFDKVHVKVQFKDQIRRFSVPAGSYHYDSLVQHLKRLFDLSVDSELQIKYKDDENDMIIISSDEELKSAIEFFSIAPLRLNVELISCVRVCNRGQRKGCGERKGSFLNFKIEILTNKRNQLSEKLNRCGESSPHLKAKILCIDTRLNQLKEFASSLPQETAPQSVPVQMPDASASESSSEGKCGRRGRGCGGKWKDIPLDVKIQFLTQKRDRLSEKLKNCGGSAPRLEGRIAWIEEKIKKMKEFAPQDNAQTPQSVAPPCVPDANTDSSSEGKCGRRGRGCGGKWKNVPLDVKIELLTQKRNNLSEKLKEIGAPAPRLEARIACIDGKIKKMKESSVLPPQAPPSTQVPPPSHESLSEGKKGRGCGKWANDPIRVQMWNLKKEQKQLKQVVQQCPESELGIHVERLVAIQDEIAQLKQKKREQSQ